MPGNTMKKCSEKCFFTDIDFLLLLFSITVINNTMMQYYEQSKYGQFHQNIVGSHGN